MPMNYAKSTSVSVEKSRSEIERDLNRAGATGFAYARTESKVLIEFTTHERRVRFVLILPLRTEDRFQYRLAYGRKRQNSSDQIETLWEQACRASWRALALLVKSKLTAVESGITTFEDEFLAHIVIPGEDGKTTTVGQWITPQLGHIYNGGKMPPLLTAHEE